MNGAELIRLVTIVYVLASEAYSADRFRTPRAYAQRRRRKAIKERRKHTQPDLGL